MEQLTPQETSSALASGPGTVTVKDKTYLVEKTTTAQVFAMYEWGFQRARTQYNPFRELVEALAGLPVTPEQMAPLLTQAHQVKAAGEIPGELVTRCLRSTDGVAFQLWITTRKHHPDVTLEQLTAAIDESNRLDVYVQLDVATGANIVNKAMISAGFFPPPSPAANTGSSATVAIP